MTPTELQAAAARVGCIYQGEGMGLHHFIERESGGNFSMVVPFPSLVAEKAADVRRRFGLPSRWCRVCGSDKPRTGLLCADCGDIESILPVASATHATTQSGTT